MSIQIDGYQVRFWARKADAIAALESIGWQPKHVVPVHTRFCRGYALQIPWLGGLLSRERFRELFITRNGANDQARVLQFMEELNAVPKLENAPTPWGDCVHLLTDHRGAWIECPITGVRVRVPRPSRRDAPLEC